ncbi:MAG: GNAT family N-acetyltransferase [Vicinamibacterales bacterium]
MIIRRGEAADASALAALAERTFRETFAGDNTPADMAAHCAASYSTAIQGRELADTGMDTLVCVDSDGQLIAFAQLRPGAPPPVTGPSPIELWRFYVDRPHHGRGVAQRLMAEVVNTARARAALTLWLGVWERNLRAQAFYRKAGFSDVGAHEFRVGSDVQTDRLMSRSLR